MPQLKDILKEYQLAGRGKVKVDFVDPLEAPEIEREAGEKYGVKPVQFQTSNKYQAAIVNSYFDVVVVYGDQFQRLDWQSLIEVKIGGTDERQVDVELRNPEYDITSAIKKVVFNFRQRGNLFADIAQPVTFYGYISGDNRLPEPLKEYRDRLKEVLKSLSKEAGDKLKVEIIDPDASGSKVADEITKTYGYNRMVAGLDMTKTFWFYMLIKDQNQIVQIPLNPRDLTKESLDRNVKSALKRFSKGSLNVVAIVGKTTRLSEDKSEEKHFKYLNEFLEEDYSMRSTDLKDGLVPPDADILLIMAPEKLDSMQVYAIDQFLMKGGTVVISSNAYEVYLNKAVLAANVESGLDTWLADKGIKIEKSMVLDRQFAPFPIPKQRVVGHYMVDETHLIPYPYFPNIRGDGLNAASGLTSGVGEVTMPWSSPITIDNKKNQGRKVTTVLSSSPASWTNEDGNVEPDLEKYPQLGFEPGKDLGPKVLSTMVEGTFDSFYKGKQSPLSVRITGADKPGASPASSEYRSGVIEKSSNNARIILFASNAFVSDEYLTLSTMATGTRNFMPVELIKNTLDWSLGDRDLLALRGRGHFARTLYPMGKEGQFIFECMNYAAALIGLGIVWAISKNAKIQRRKRHRKMLGLEGVKA